MDDFSVLSLRTQKTSLEADGGCGEHVDDTKIDVAPILVQIWTRWKELSLRVSEVDLTSHCERREATKVLQTSVPRIAGIIEAIQRGHDSRFADTSARNRALDL